MDVFIHKIVSMRNLGIQFFSAREHVFSFVLKTHRNLGWALDSGRASVLHITSYLGKVGTGRRHKLGFMLKKNLVIFYNSSANGRYPESSTSYYYQVGNKVFLGDYNSRQRSILPYLAVVY